MSNYKKYAIITDNGKIIAYGIFHNLNQCKYLESKSLSLKSLYDYQQKKHINY